jgi:hypothetical protein
MSKAQIVAELAERSGIDRKQVQSVLTELLSLAERELGKNGPGEFVVPDMVKLRVKLTPGRDAHEGIDPFTKEKRTFPARPPSRKVRASVLKRVKDLVA